MPKYTDLFPVECRVEATGTGDAQVLDTIPIAVAWGAEWEVVAQETGTGNTEARTFRAVHNGTSVNKSEFGHMIVTTPISGLELDANIVSGVSGQELQLFGYSDNEVNFRVLRKRIG